MSWEEEKGIYSRKLRKLIDGIGQIKNIESNRLITPDMEKDLDKALKNAEKLLPKLA